MTIGELFRSLDRDAVVAAALRCDGGVAASASAAEGYRAAWDAIVRLHPASTTMICVLTLEAVPPDDWTELVVSGRASEGGETVGLDFVPWAEWLSMPIELGPGVAMAPEEVLGHVLSEMTWYGFDEEAISSVFESVKTSAANVGRIASSVDSDDAYVRVLH